jgi:hypothetical protein
MSGPPTRNRDGLAAQSGEGKGSERRGDRGDLIERVLMAFNSRGVTGGVTPASCRFQREKREETVAVMMLTRGSHQSVRGEREESTASGRGLPGLRA